MGPWAGALVAPSLALLVFFMAHCSSLQPEGFSEGWLDASRPDLWARANGSALQGFWCQPASQLSRDQLSALIKRMDTQQVPLQAWQLSCLANLASKHSLQGDFQTQPPNLLLFYNLSQVRQEQCRNFTGRAAQGDMELLTNLPDQRVALQRMALTCLGGPRLELNATDLQLLGGLVCDLDAASIRAADPHVLQNLRSCHWLTKAQQDSLNQMLASGRTTLGPPESWNLEGLQSLGPLATYISPSLWVQVHEAVGLDFFGSMVAAYRKGQLSQTDAQRFVTSFLEAKARSSRLRRGTGRRCKRGDITGATLRDDLFLVRYDCGQLESCLGPRVLRANLDPLLQHPLPAECQRVVKAKLGLIYPGGLPEEKLPRVTSLVYLYSCAEISQWNITSMDTLVALLASDVALDNQTEALLQKYLDHNGTLTGALLVAIGGSRLCWMSPQQIQIIEPSEFRLAGALDISSCPQSRKNVLFAKAQEAFRSTQTTDAYYRFMRPYLGGAPVEELRHLAQANVSMDIDTFTNLNPHVLQVKLSPQSPGVLQADRNHLVPQMGTVLWVATVPWETRPQNLSVDNVNTLLGQNVGDLRKARSHPTISSWLRSLNSSALGELGLETGPAGHHIGRSTHRPPSTTPLTFQIAHSAGLLAGDSVDIPNSGGPKRSLGCLPLAMVLPAGLLWLLYQSSTDTAWHNSSRTHTAASRVSLNPVPQHGLAGGANHLPRQRCRPLIQGNWLGLPA